MEQLHGVFPAYLLSLSQHFAHIHKIGDHRHRAAISDREPIDRMVGNKTIDGCPALFQVVLLLQADDGKSVSLFGQTDYIRQDLRLTQRVGHPIKRHEKYVGGTHILFFVDLLHG